MSLRDADEIMEEPPRWTGEEKQRIRQYRPPGTVDFNETPRCAPGQTRGDIERIRREYIADWGERMRWLGRAG
jgi:hypothetical protein